MGNPDRRMPLSHQQRAGRTRGRSGGCADVAWRRNASEWSQHAMQHARLSPAGYGRCGNRREVCAELMRLLVTGGRDYADRANVWATLDAIHAATPIATVIHGACPTGADRHAAEWAANRGVGRERIPPIGAGSAGRRGRSGTRRWRTVGPTSLWRSRAEPARPT